MREKTLVGQFQAHPVPVCVLQCRNLTCFLHFRISLMPQILCICNAIANSFILFSIRYQWVMWDIEPVLLSESLIMAQTVGGGDIDSGWDEGCLWIASDEPLIFGQLANVATYYSLPPAVGTNAFQWDQICLLSFVFCLLSFVFCLYMMWDRDCNMSTICFCCHFFPLTIRDFFSPAEKVCVSISCRFIISCRCCPELTQNLDHTDTSCFVSDSSVDMQCFQINSSMVLQLDI